MRNTYSFLDSVNLHKFIREAKNDDYENLNYLCKTLLENISKIPKPSLIDTFLEKLGNLCEETLFSVVNENTEETFNTILNTPDSFDINFKYVEIRPFDVNNLLFMAGIRYTDDAIFKDKYVATNTPYLSGTHSYDIPENLWILLNGTPESVIALSLIKSICDTKCPYSKAPLQVAANFSASYRYSHGGIVTEKLRVTITKPINGNTYIGYGDNLLSAILFALEAYSKSLDIGK